MVLRQQQRLFQRREAVALARKSLAQRHSDQAEVWLDRTEFQELIRPPLDGVVEVLGSDLKTRSDLKTTVTPIPTTVEAPGLAGSRVHTPAWTQAPRWPSTATISSGSTDVQERQRAPRRFTRFAAAGILALVGGTASVPLITPHSATMATTTVGAGPPPHPRRAATAGSTGGCHPGTGPRQQSAQRKPQCSAGRPTEHTSRGPRPVSRCCIAHTSNRSEHQPTQNSDHHDDLSCTAEARNPG
jgi:hypothetical protein